MTQSLTQNYFFARMQLGKLYKIFPTKVKVQWFNIFQELYIGVCIFIYFLLIYNIFDFLTPQAHNKLLQIKQATIFCYQ
jgi:hypothetical protein